MRGLTGQSARKSELAPLRRWLQARERTAILAWLGLLAILFGALLIWGVGMRGAEHLVDKWNARTTRALSGAEELVRAGKWQEAATELERIDASHPALFIKHRLDQERERTLELLGECWVKLDRKRRALDAYARLVAFDPRNWHNHWLYAEALRHFSETDLADAEYRDVLLIHPNHLPTVEVLTGMLFDVATLYAKVVELHRQYLEAQLLAQVTLELGEHQVRFDMPVDGRAHALSAPVELPEGWKGEARLSTHGYSVRIGAVALVPALRVGERGRPEVQAVQGGWRESGAAALDAPGLYSALEPRSSFQRQLEAPHGAARVELELTLYKAMNQGLWTKVEISYRNRLLFDELEAARSRTVIGGCLEAGSSFED